MMQNRSFIPHTVKNTARSIRKTSSYLRPTEDLTRIFNTVLISTNVHKPIDYAQEMGKLTQSTSFQAILKSIQHLSQIQGISEQEATQQIIDTFRSMEKIWKDYLQHQGLETLRCQSKPR